MRMLRAAPEHAPMLATLRQKAWAATYRGIYPDEMIDRFDFSWHIARETKNLQNPDIFTWFILEGGEYQGYVTYIIKKEPIWLDYHVRLFSLYLLPPLQGRGLGRSILEYVKQECRSHGFTKLYVSCAPQNLPAMGFYHHMGGTIVRSDVGNGNPQEDSVEFEFIC